MRLITFLSILFVAVPCYTQTAYPGWSHNAAIEINTTPTGANIPGTASETNFPLAVKLEQGSIDFSQIKSDGDDIRFSSSSNVPLSYQIESWDDNTGKAVVWVKIPSIQGNATQTIYVYWGNAAAATESNGTAVFETVNGYTGVWHLGEAANNTADGFKDATSNAAHGTGVNMNASASALGMVGNAIDFESDDQQYITIKNEPLFDFTNTLTASLWFKQESFHVSWQSWLAKGDGAWRITRSGGNDRVGFQLNGPGGVNATQDINDGKWHHVVGVIDGNNKIIYLDGTVSASSSLSGPVDLTDEDLWIGNNSRQTSRWHDGLIDEVRVSATARSADWIKMSYENQRQDGLMVGPPKETGCVKNFGVVAATVAANEGETFVVKGNATCADQFQWVEVNGNTETFLDPGLNVVRNYKRITGQTVLTWRLKALYGNTWETSETVVTINDVIPNPQFNLVSGHTPGTTWNGQDAFEIILTISNQAAIAALNPPYNEINIDWSFTGARVYKTYTDSSVIINRAFENGTLNVSVCLDNKGEIICDTPNYTVSLPAIAALPPSQPANGKLKVFVLAGQSNMEGYGRTEGVGVEGSLDWLLADPQYVNEFSPLVDNSNVPLVYNDVWVYYPKEDIGSYALKSLEKGPLSPMYGVKDPSGSAKTIGPEYGFGIHMSQYFQDQVLLIKTAWGGHSLGVKFRPPGMGGELGTSYTHMLEIVQEATTDLKTHFPQYNDQGFEIVGMGWHQGFNDQFCANCKPEYAENLATLIEDVRKEWNNSRLPFAIGESGMLCGTGADDICASQAEVATFAGFDGNVSFSPTKQWHLDPMGPGAGYHWYESFYSMYKVGDAMGQAMVDMLSQSVEAKPREVQGILDVNITTFPEFFQIDVPPMDQYTVIISGVSGQRIKTFNINRSRSFAISREGLDNGIYYIQIKSGLINISKKLLLM